ncbi:MAG: hypothetical protein ABIL58_26360 [Pseudomonadota bacterium]
MPKKKSIDEKALLAMVQDGVAQKAIMEKLGLKTPTQLKVAYANALMAAGTVPEIKKGRKTPAKAAVSKVATVNKRGSLVITKILVEEMGFVEGDAFAIRKTKSGISLRKA